MKTINRKLPIISNLFRSSPAVQRSISPLNRPQTSNRKLELRSSKLALTAVFGALLAAPSAFAADYTVTTTDDTVADDGELSLREAIIAANANVDANGHCVGINNITFSFNTGPNASVDGTNYYQIKINYFDPDYLGGTVATPLPVIRCPVNIDAYAGSPGGATPGTIANPYPQPRVELSGHELAATFVPTDPTPAISAPPEDDQRYPAGLMFVGRHPESGCKGGSVDCALTRSPDGSTVRGLIINKFPRHAIYLYGTDGATVIGNYFGLDVTGERSGYANGRAELAGFGSSANDLRLDASSSTFVGTTQADYPGTIAPNGANRNVFGSSGRGAISLQELNENTTGFGMCADPFGTLIPPNGTTCRHPEFGSANNVFQGNYIGLNKEGNCAIGGFDSTGVPGDPGKCNSDGSRSIGPNEAALYSARGSSTVYFATAPFFTSSVWDISSNTNVGNVFGGLKPGQGNVVVACRTTCFFVGAPGTQILGNIMGLNAAGTSDTATITAIGRTPLNMATFGTTVEGNVLANSSTVQGAGAGITFTLMAKFTGLDDLAPNIVRNNFIGTNAAGAKNIGNQGGGVKAAQPMPVRLENNVIAYNGQSDSGPNGAPNGFAGVTAFPGILDLAFLGQGLVEWTPNRVSILNNKIYCNGKRDPLALDPDCGRGMGIDLNPTVFTATPGGSPPGTGDGVTLNDLGDADTGPNELQNFPDPTQAKLLNGDKLLVEGQLQSEPNGTYRIEAFRNASSDPERQGRTFLGYTILTVGGNGQKSFSFRVSNASSYGVTLGDKITTTATRLDSSGAPLFTSEFSDSVLVKK